MSPSTSEALDARMGHRIAAISYSSNRVECTCGAITTAAQGLGWADHRRRAGLKVVSIGQSIGKRLSPKGLAASSTVGSPTSEEAPA